MISGVRLNVIVEGSTEETFIRDFLAPALGAKMIFLNPRKIETSRHIVRGSHLTGRDQIKIYRGGIASFAKAKRDIERWLKEDTGAHVTTMFDYYALPEDFPGMQSLPLAASPHEKIRIIEKALVEDISNRRFIPHIQLHEFETLLFSDISVIDKILSVLEGKSQIKLLEEIVEEVQINPEKINDGTETAPSKRLFNLYPSYKKMTSGLRIIEQIGLKKIRDACPHFNEWVTLLESLNSVEET